MPSLLRQMPPRRTQLSRIGAASSSSSRPFSASTQRSVRQRPTTRTRAGAARGAPRSSCHPPTATAPPPQTDTQRPAAGEEPPRHHGIASRRTAAPPSATTTSPVDGPPRPHGQVLLSSKLIHHRGGTPRSHLATGTTPLQARQLSAAEKFFLARAPPPFLYSAALPRDHPPNTHTPEVILLGASNVGKSTLVNALLGCSSSSSSSAAARVSQKPGRTTLMNAFGVGPPPMRSPLLPRGTPAPPPRHRLVLVDTPGYGHRSQASWGAAVTTYLRTRSMLRGAVLLLSSDKTLLPRDRWMLRTLAERNTRTLVVLTKADKGRAAWAGRCLFLADEVEKELLALHREFGGRWRDSDGAAAHIHVTSAGMHPPGKLRNGAGIGGVRAAILEMAGFALCDTVADKADTVTYGGPIVSFDDIPSRT